jgi:DNA-binding NtrC family response regulator
MEIIDRTSARKIVGTRFGERKELQTPPNVTEVVDSRSGPSLAALTILARALMTEINQLGEPFAQNSLSFSEQVVRFEKELIRSALAQTGGKQRRAAGLLSMKVSTLHRKIKLYGLGSLQITDDAPEQ